MTQGRNSGRKAPKQARSRELVDAVVTAGRQLLLEQGPEATTNMIAVRAGVSIGSLYRYFPDKYAIFDAVGARYAAELWPFIESLGEDLRHLPLARAAARVVSFARESEASQPVGLAQALDQIRASGEVLPSMDAFEQRAEVLMVEVLTQRIGGPSPGLAESVARLTSRGSIAIVRGTVSRAGGLGEGLLHQMERLLSALTGVIDPSDHAQTADQGAPEHPTS